MFSMAWGDEGNIISNCGYYWDVKSQEWKSIPIQKYSLDEIKKEWQKQNPKSDAADVFRISGYKDISI